MDVFRVQLECSEDQAIEFCEYVDIRHLHTLESFMIFVDNFIDNCIRIESKRLVIVHGKGEGILKKSTHDYLKKDKRVLEYKINIFNDGETIVTLK